MTTVVLKNSYLTEKVELVKREYDNGSLAIQAIDMEGMPFATLSVNMPPHSDELPKTMCFMKVWGENEGFLESLVEAGLVKLKGVACDNGYVKAPLVEVLF